LQVKLATNDDQRYAPFSSHSLHPARARPHTHTHTYSWGPGTLQAHEANIITWKCWQTRRESKNSYYSWQQEETFFKPGIKQRRVKKVK
jgi:hypothetical protein